MKVKALLVALFAVGLVASLAFAASPLATRSDTTTSIATTAPEHNNKPHCQNLELKGSVSGGSIALTVRRASEHGRDLVGKQISFAVAGDVSAKVRACGAAGAQTYELRVLKVAEHGDDHGTTTTH